MYIVDIFLLKAQTKTFVKSWNLYFNIKNISLKDELRQKILPVHLFINFNFVSV